MSGPDTRQRAEAFISRCLHPYADEHDVPAITDELHDLAGSWDVGSLPTLDFWQVVKRHALPRQEGSAPHDGDVLQQNVLTLLLSESGPHDGDALPDLDAPGAATREVAWVAREARALRGSDDEQRRARFTARKAALLAHIETTTGGGDGSCS